MSAEKPHSGEKSDAKVEKQPQTVAEWRKVWETNVKSVGNDVLDSISFSLARKFVPALKDRKYKGFWAHIGHLIDDLGSLGTSSLGVANAMFDEKISSNIVKSLGGGPKVKSAH